MPLAPNTRLKLKRQPLTLRDTTTKDKLHQEDSLKQPLQHMLEDTNHSLRGAVKMRMPIPRLSLAERGAIPLAVETSTPLRIARNSNLRPPASIYELDLHQAMQFEGSEFVI